MRRHARRRVTRWRHRHKVHEPVRRVAVVRLFVTLLLVATLLLAGCSGGSDGGTPAGQTTEIAMHNQVYEPAKVTVAKGDVLRFAAHDTAHSARTMDGSYDAGDIAQGQSKDVAMDRAGTFVFKCRFHSAMQLTVTVTA